MSKRAARNTRVKLIARQAGYDRMPAGRRTGYKRPGSQNSHKQGP